MKCSEIIDLIELLAPPSYACDWDNPGLVVGRKEREIRTILTALDATRAAVEKAMEEKADLIVTHHPMIFSSIKKINDGDFLGEKLLTLAENKISCYAMHTNYDIAGGMAEICGSRIGLLDPVPFEMTGEKEGRPVGIGQVGELPEEMTLLECADKVKEAFGLSDLLVFGDLSGKVKRAAISPGSGRSMLREAGEAQVDVLITGDIGHHEGLDSMDMGFSVIEAGHYGLEQVFIQHITEYLTKKTKNVKVIPFYEGVPYKIV
ncbi:MAG: Nif3-like dinuclear metal center hexameric protein [Lachnospiraceae bacterium]|nr:Nif3-like dinuclear metal center hexameric protein [Lachnospiraceae bacterium]